MAKALGGTRPCAGSSHGGGRRRRRGTRVGGSDGGGRWQGWIVPILTASLPILLTWTLNGCHGA